MPAVVVIVLQRHLGRHAVVAGGDVPTPGAHGGQDALHHGVDLGGIEPEGLVDLVGFFAAALWVFSFLSAPLAGKLSYLLSMLNVWAFFGPMAYRSVRAWIRREQWKRKNRR